MHGTSSGMRGYERCLTYMLDRARCNQEDLCNIILGIAIIRGMR